MVEGFDIHISAAGRYIVTDVDGKAVPVTIEEYKGRLAARLVEEAPTLDEFRSRWIVPSERSELIAQMPDAGRSVIIVQRVEDMNDYDLYDVLAELGYGMNPRKRNERAEAYYYKNQKHGFQICRCLLPIQSRRLPHSLPVMEQTALKIPTFSEYRRLFRPADFLRCSSLATLLTFS